MKNNSLGLIETWGLVPAIEAADAASKAARVSLLGYELARAGLVTVKVVGDVAAVQAAVSAGAAAAAKMGKVVSVHVIPRPDRQLRITPPATGKPPERPEAGSSSPLPPSRESPLEAPAPVAEKAAIPEAPTQPGLPEPGAPIKPASGSAGTGKRKKRQPFKSEGLAKTKPPSRH